MQDTARVGIPTVYDGIEYRSRLEAKWAAFFRKIGWEFTYEPFDGNGYIPDFLIHGESPLLVEVKPAVTLADYKAPVGKMERGLLSQWENDFFIVGASPLPDGTRWIKGRFGTGGYSHRAGWLGQVMIFDEYGHYFSTELIQFDSRGVCFGRECDWADGLWHICRECNAISIHHEIQSYHSRPCGCYEGNNTLIDPDIFHIQSLWNEATNDVKWRGRNA